MRNTIRRSRAVAWTENVRLEVNVDESEAVYRVIVTLWVASEATDDESERRHKALQLLTAIDRPQLLSVIRSVLEARSML